MAKYKWSVRIKGREPEVIKHFNWITHMYNWILARKYFKGKTLVICRNESGSYKYIPIIEVDYGTIVARKQIGLKEGDERKEIMRIGKELEKATTLAKD